MIVSLRSSPLVLLLVLSACSDAEDASVAMGGGRAVVLAGHDAPCPTGFPDRVAFGDVTLCGDGAFDPTSVTRGECAQNRIDCDALYGCTDVSLEDCDSTLTSADCGGDGPTTFACAEDRSSTCRWFVHGCVAEGYRASNCPAADLCCEPSTMGGDAAFPDGTDETSSYAGWATQAFTGFFGDDPIALDDGFHLAVVSTEPTASEEITVSCPPSGGTSPCGGVLTSVVEDDRWRVTGSSLGGWRLHVDFRTIGGERVARACMFSVPDGAVNRCFDSRSLDDACASGGTVQYGTEGIRMTATFPSGDWIVEVPL